MGTREELNVVETRRPRTWEQVLEEQLQDPAFRARWERYAPARAMADALIRYRIEHDLSQSQLAKLLGVKQPTVARWETGEHNPTWETLLLLAQKLSISTSLTVEPTTPSSASVVEEIARLVKNGIVSRMESPITGTSATIVTRTPGTSDTELARV
jgi:transcriptional regulator with XRE-family HTH domain